MIILSDTDEEIDKIGGRKISVKNLNASIDCGKIKGENLLKGLWHTLKWRRNVLELFT